MTGAVAAIDIGTNSIRLLITDADGAEVDRRMVITRLGQGVDASGRLHPDAIERSLAVLAEYAAAIDAAGVPASRRRATATSAARDAANADDFTGPAQALLATSPEVISGEEEAQLSFAGATAGLDPSAGPFLIMDVGGGSTEFVLGATGPDALISLDMGCVRMTERHLHDDPPTPAQLAAATADAEALLAEAAQSVPFAKATTMIGLAGTISTLSALQAGVTTYDPARQHHNTLTRDWVASALADLGSLDVEARRARLLEPKRADVIVGGIVVVAAAMDACGFDRLLTSETDILDGLAASIRARDGGGATSTAATAPTETDASGAAGT